MIEFIGYILALLVGISLGLLGGGGAIIIIPVLVYLFKKDVITASSYSLFIVFVSALIGSLRNVTKKSVDIKAAIIFGIPDIIAMYFVRRFIIPIIPKELYNFNEFVFTRDMGILSLFAIIILITSFSMIRGKETNTTDQSKSQDYSSFKLSTKGLLTGALTGLIGIGGGFLIVPSLVFLARLPIKKAVATSLIIITLKSAIGFIGDLQTGLTIEWGFLVVFSLLAVTGIFIGQWVTSKISGQNLKRLFGFFALAMAIFILLKELL